MKLKWLLCFMHKISKATYVMYRFTELCVSNFFFGCSAPESNIFKSFYDAIMEEYFKSNFSDKMH